jgi:uncharacterized membrane protein
MQSIPSMWRQELIHPLLVHLPIALIPIATLFLFIYLVFSKKVDVNYLRPAFSWLLFISCIGVAFAMKSGEWAENVVNKVICDPTITKKHEEFAEIVTALVMVCGVLEMLRIVLHRIKSKFIFIHELKLNIAICTFMFFATLTLFQVGHLGASLTYQQASAVYIPSKECSEFE